MPQVQDEIAELRARLAQLEKSKKRPRGRTNHVGAARYLNISEETLRRMYDRGERAPPRSRLGPRIWSYSYDDLDRWLAERGEQGGA
jgi:hypothetical protein